MLGSEIADVKGSSSNQVLGGLPNRCPVDVDVSSISSVKRHVKLFSYPDGFVIGAWFPNLYFLASAGLKSTYVAVKAFIFRHLGDAGVQLSEGSRVIPDRSSLLEYS